MDTDKEKICPVLKDKCIEGKCMWWIDLPEDSEHYETRDCAIVVIAEGS